MNKHFQKLAIALMTSALIALAGWVYTTGSRVAALEAQLPTIQQALSDIRTDVREVRNWVVPRPPAGQR